MTPADPPLGRAVRRAGHLRRAIRAILAGPPPAPAKDAQAVVGARALRRRLRRQQEGGAPS